MTIKRGVSLYSFQNETFLGLMRLRGVECRSADGFAEAFVVRKALL